MFAGIPSTKMIYSLPLFDSLTKALVTTVKRFMIDLEKVKDLYKKRELDDVASILSEHNLADPFAKVKNQMYLVIVLDKAKINHLIQQWIIRKKCETLIQKDGILG